MIISNVSHKYTIPYMVIHAFILLQYFKFMINFFSFPVKKIHTLL